MTTMTKRALLTKLILTTLGLGSCVGLAALYTRGEQRSKDDHLPALTSCQATARKAKLDGEVVTIAGRYYLNPASSNDAPQLLSDEAECRTPDAQGAVIVDTSHPGDSPASKEFQKYQVDLVPNLCPPKTICLPEKIARYLFVDIVAKGHFDVIPSEKRTSAYCCQFTVEDVSSVHLGPEQKPKGTEAGTAKRTGALAHP